MSDLDIISNLFLENLLPIKEDIRELKINQKKVVDLLLTQARQDEKIKSIDIHLEECKEWRKNTEIRIDEKFDDLDKKEHLEDKKKEIVLWDIIKVLLYILAGGTVGSAISKLLLH